MKIGESKWESKKSCDDEQVTFFNIKI